MSIELTVLPRAVQDMVESRIVTPVLLWIGSVAFSFNDITPYGGLTDNIINKCAGRRRKIHLANLMAGRPREAHETPAGVRSVGLVALALRH